MKSFSDKKIPTMTLSKGIIAVGLGIYIKKLSALVIADLHIGYEEALEEQGIHIPAIQLNYIKSLLDGMIREVNPNKVIILGDVKHEFGSALRQEWNETLDLLNFLINKKLEVHVVRGNHDNFLIPILRRLNVPFHDPYYIEKSFLFVHGHKPIGLDILYSDKIKYIFEGHEHPAISIRDELGIKSKFKCFLKGKIDDKEFFVLPALSPLMPGTEINILEEGRYMSYLLKISDADSLEVFVTEPEIGIFYFGELGRLRKLNLFSS